MRVKGREADAVRHEYELGETTRREGGKHRKKGKQSARRLFGFWRVPLQQ
jgi:hypothetical protein